MRLGVRVGVDCTALNGRLMRDLRVSRIELEETWPYLHKKQRIAKPEDGGDNGDQYILLVLDAVGKGILS